ncbi:MAG: hypothetical protein BMS9Abin12_0741 [Acidimicrobiia bacterium]|nr:MAG: hypothetical protein BMS9Abin12_0741 [Acidimicrobiia bacterium]
MRTRVNLLLVVAAALAVLFAVPVSAHVRPTLGLLPDGDTRPEINSAELRNPQRHNALLEADLVVDATDNDGIARFEYRWNGATFGPVQSATVDRPQVDYASIRPDSKYALELRAVDIHNNPSEWYLVWSGTTPSPPHIIVAGDSIASGYTRRWFTGDATCRDSDLSYGSTVVSGISAKLPDQWAPTYTNIAWAGAGVDDMLSGGSDSCGGNHSSQLGQIEALSADDTWNIVVVTAGINSTNWTDVIVDLTRDTALSLTASGDRRACDLALRDNWNIDARSDSITRDTRRIVESLGRSTNARVFWTGYYDIAGTELAPMWTPVGSECERELDQAMRDLHIAIRTGLDDNITWVDIDRDIATQSWAGWPHPDRNGHVTIGRAIVRAIYASS